ncbi:DNA alkylation repair protein [candidate division KSB1 bacterium]
MSIILLRKTLRSYASPERKESNEWFFKTGKGQYGYGDKFIGVRDPDAQKAAKQFKDLPLKDVKKLLESKIHEERATALRILVLKFEAGDKKGKKEVYDFYLKNFKYVNNWDLVDVSAYKIVGAYMREHPKSASVLSKYAQSKNLWERRLSIVATLAFIRNNEFNWTMKNAKILLADTHDLTHKAVGWMLREVWKRDHKIVEDFLIKNYKQVPRTTLRYAIERMEEKKRKQFLKGFN